ncbi:MAG: aspartate--tRNA ligase [Ignavibacteria bacterium]|nr:aspartate--tRNA ligase [Ignavibacteria bacterium]
MIFKKRTHTCGELRLTDINSKITLNGWVSKKRDLGGLLFIDIRDRYGLTQIKIAPENTDAYTKAIKLGQEFVISVSGKVIKRESINKNIPTGEIEIEVSEMEVLNESEVPPFVIEEDVKASDELRLKYRYLDIRRKNISDNLILRSKVSHIVHRYFEKNNFVEIETPVLMKSTPEGARDYLVPSRVHKGKFYALPQSPQIYKQILMVSGMDRYVQICKCFRDEDLRADRQPEFTQIDLEMSFVTQDDVFEILEGMFGEIWKEVKGIELPVKFRRMTYDEAMKNYGSDKPDLRIKGDMKIENLSEIVKNSEFKVFQDALSVKAGVVAGIKLSGKEVTRKIIDSLTDFIKKLGFGGLGYLKYNSDGTVQSPMTKFLTEEILTGIKELFKAENGDTVFILSGENLKVLQSLGSLRLKLAEDFKLTDESLYEFLWVTDFPLFHYDEEEKRFFAEHHVFTMPKDEYLKFLDSRDKDEVESIRANCYDLVLNGHEITSGSIRIHKPDIQKKVFDMIGLTDEEAKMKFGFILEAFRYGAPPHGGAAVGYDRVIAILAGLKSITDTIAFPKTLRATSLMDECPSEVSGIQLEELGIEISKPAIKQ